MSQRETSRHPPSLDELAAAPWRLDELSPEAIASILRRITALASCAATYISTASAPDRLLGAEEASMRMGKRVSWMKDAGRRLEFAVRVGREWRWSEAGVNKWIRLKERGR
jgi:hypothetical protein